MGGPKPKHGVSAISKPDSTSNFDVLEFDECGICEKQSQIRVREVFRGDVFELDAGDFDPGIPCRRNIARPSVELEDLNFARRYSNLGNQPHYQCNACNQGKQVPRTNANSVDHGREPICWNLSISHRI